MRGFITPDFGEFKKMSAVVTAPVEIPSTKIFSKRWIISQTDDLIWFIGSVLTSYLLFGLYVSGILPLILMVVVWAVLIDAPHVFGTFTRTYFDREERRNRKRLLFGSLAFFIIGPVFVLLGQALLFFFVAALWAYYHLVKQHYGFMILYKKKNEDLAPVDNKLDKIFLMLAFVYPFVYFAGTDKQALARVPQTVQIWLGLATNILLFATIAVGIIWLGRQIWLAFTRQNLNLPKYLLLSAAIPMHWVVLLTPMPNKPLAIVAILTIYHNFQYHRLIWFHNQKYRKDNSHEKFGKAAAFLSRNLWVYVLFGVIFGVWYQVPRQYVTFTYGRGEFITNLVASFFWGYAFIHYYLDSKIWRVRRDANVGKALKMA
jgi:hypothetical protein